MLRPITIRDNEKEKEKQEIAYQRMLIEKRLSYSEWLQYRETVHGCGCLLTYGERQKTCDDCVKR